MKGLTRRTLLAAGAGACCLAVVPVATAQLRIEISGVGANQIPIALIPLNGTQETGIDIMKVVGSDLARSGAFRRVDAEVEATLAESIRPDLIAWRGREVNIVATGSIIRLADGHWDVRYRLFDTVKEDLLDQAQFTVTDRQLRLTAHRIADRIYDKLTGLGAMFASRLAYVVQYEKNRYELIVADSDGANAQPVLLSREPIISPTWSPDGKQLAYVSFEKKKPVVYVHTVASGQRHVVANFRGNNSAPAFTADGKRLAVALSRDGYTQLFTMSVLGGEVARLTRSMAIDTEPVFSADGQYVYFTSDRGGAPQIYRQNATGGLAERITFASNYAVSPSLNPSGTHLAYVTRADGRYRVATLELATGQEMVLSRTELDESPCFSPNGQMIVFATERQGRGVLATVSTDGAVHSWLTGPSGDIREPTWSPILK
jgi:TolB protein